MPEFKYPGTAVYNPVGGYCVCWSIEEFKARLAEGWSPEKPAAPGPAMLQESDESFEASEALIEARPKRGRPRKTEAEA